MAKLSKKSTTILIVVIAITALLGAKSYLDAKRQATTLSQQAKTKGNVNAPVKIVEYIDFQCPACAQGAKFLTQFMKENPDAIRLEMKYFPLRMHRHAFLSSQYAECAARQDKFWPYHDYLVNRQNEWKQMFDARPAFDIIAQTVGLDEGKLKVCLADESINDIILAHKEEGKALGIKSTPTYFINNKMLVGSVNLSSKIMEILGEKKN